MISYRILGYFWLLTMAFTLAVGGYTGARWMIEAGLAGLVGFGIGTSFRDPS